MSVNVGVGYEEYIITIGDSKTRFNIHSYRRWRNLPHFCAYLLMSVPESGLPTDKELKFLRKIAQRAEGRIPASPRLR